MLNEFDVTLSYKGNNKITELRWIISTYIQTYHIRNLELSITFHSYQVVSVGTPNFSIASRWPLSYRVTAGTFESVIFRVCDVWMDNMLLWTLFLFQVPWFALFHIVCNNYHCVFWECTSASSSSLFSPTSDPRSAAFLVRLFPFLSLFLTPFLHLLKLCSCVL
jgi:hypothetical protein